MKSNLKYLYLPVLIMALTFFVGCDDDEPGPTDQGTDTVDDMVADEGEDMVPDTVEDMVPDESEDLVPDEGLDLLEDADAEPPVMVTCTFNIDTTTTVDGANELAFVPDGYLVYIAGNAFGNWGEFNTPQWDPRYPENVLDDNEDGTYTIEYEIEAGTALEFKFLISNELAGTGNGWANGEKDWADVDGGNTCAASGTANCACLNARDTEAGTAWLTDVGIDFGSMEGGLWEIANRTELVPDDGSTEHTFGTYFIEAWRDYASYTYDYYHSCD